MRKLVYRYFPKLLRAALNNDRKNVEAIALMIGKKLKKEDPEVSAEIMKILSSQEPSSRMFMQRRET